AVTDGGARLRATVEQQHAAVTTLSTEVATLRTRWSGIDEALHARQAERVANEKDLEQSLREHERVSRHIETITAEARQVAGEAVETETLLGRLGQHVEAARDAESRHETAMAAVRAAIETAQLGETPRGARLTEARVELAGIAERAEAFGRELARLDEMETDFTARIEQARRGPARRA